MATIKLIFGRTECALETQWANLKECEVEVPSWVTKDSETWGRFHLLGMVTEPTKAATGDECFEGTGGDGDGTSWDSLRNQAHGWTSRKDWTSGL